MVCIIHCLQEGHWKRLRPAKCGYLFDDIEFVENDRFTLIGDDYACPYFGHRKSLSIMPFFII